MTKFNTDNKDILTYSECLDPAMKITNIDDANQYISEYIKYINKSKNDIFESEKIAKSNLGYYAGYYDSETRERVERLFMCQHPIFGSIKENGVPTAKEAFEAGLSYKKNNKF